MIPPEKLKILTPLQKLLKNAEDLGKLIVAKGLKKKPKVPKIALSGHTAGNGHFKNSCLLLFQTTEEIIKIKFNRRSVLLPPKTSMRPRNIARREGPDESPFKWAAEVASWRVGWLEVRREQPPRPPRTSKTTTTKMTRGDLRPSWYFLATLGRRRWMRPTPRAWQKVKPNEDNFKLEAVYQEDAESTYFKGSMKHCFNMETHIEIHTSD